MSSTVAEQGETTVGSEVTMEQLAANVTKTLRAIQAAPSEIREGERARKPWDWLLRKKHATDRDLVRDFLQAIKALAEARGAAFIEEASLCESRLPDIEKEIGELKERIARDTGRLREIEGHKNGNEGRASECRQMAGRLLIGPILDDIRDMEALHNEGPEGFASRYQNRMADIAQRVGAPV